MTAFYDKLVPKFTTMIAFYNKLVPFTTDKLVLKFTMTAF